MTGVMTMRLLGICAVAGKPLANVQVAVKTLPNNDPDKSKSVSNAFGNRAFSRKDGYVSCKVRLRRLGPLAGSARHWPCVVSPGRSLQPGI